MDEEMLQGSKPADPAALLKRWHFRADRMQSAYYEAGRRSDRKHHWLGFAAVILSSIVGTTVFASLSKKDIDQRFQILVGMLSILAAVLSALQTLFKFSERAEKCRVAGANFANIKARIEILQINPPASPAEYAKALNDLETRWDKTRKESPNLPQRLWEEYEKNSEPEPMP